MLVLDAGCSSALLAAATLEQWTDLRLADMRTLTSCALYMRVMVPSLRINGRRNLRESLLHLTTLLPSSLKVLRILFYVPSFDLAYPECALSPLQWIDLDDKLTRFSNLSRLHIRFEVRSVIFQSAASSEWDSDMVKLMQRYLPRVYGKKVLRYAMCIILIRLHISQKGGRHQC